MRVSEVLTRALAQEPIVLVAAGGSSGRKQEPLHTEAHLQIPVVG